MNRNSFKVGEQTRFYYNEKPREGVVEKIKDSVVVLKLDYDTEGKTHKAFSYTKIVPWDEMSILRN